MSAIPPSEIAPESEIAIDMAKRAIPLAALVVAVCAVPWGVNGALSAALAVGLVVFNFLLSAWMLTTAARISYGMLMGAALFGYLLRLGLVVGVVFAVKNAAWVELLALGPTLIVTHLGLLVWELRYVSASLAFPGLKPVNKEIATR